MSKQSNPNSNSLKKGNFLKSDLTQELADLFDIVISLITDENVILNDVPFLGTFLKAIKTPENIKNQILTHKLRIFINQLNSKQIPQDKINNFLEKLQKNHTFAEEISTKLILIIDRLSDLEKAELVAKIFGAYLEEKINYVEFRRLLDAVEQAFLDDLKELILSKKINKNHNNLYENLVSSRLTKISSRAIVSSKKDKKSQGLQGLGSIASPLPANPFGDYNSQDHAQIKYELSELGEKLLDILQE